MGTDNLKNEGGPIAQALALIGVRPRFDSYGRLAGATLIELEELGRPRIDVIATLSGIFRDLLPLQIKLLAEASFMRRQRTRPVERNFVRKHTLAHMRKQAATSRRPRCACSATPRGAYGSNVNHLIENSGWEDEDELAETLLPGARVSPMGAAGVAKRAAGTFEDRARRRRPRLPETWIRWNWA